MSSRSPPKISGRFWQKPSKALPFFLRKQMRFIHQHCMKQTTRQLCFYLIRRQKGNSLQSFLQNIPFLSFFFAVNDTDRLPVRQLHRQIIKQQRLSRPRKTGKTENSGLFPPGSFSESAVQYPAAGTSENALFSGNAPAVSTVKSGTVLHGTASRSHPHSLHSPASNPGTAAPSRPPRYDRDCSDAPDDSHC